MDEVNTAVRKAKKRASVISALDGMYNKSVTCTAGPSTSTFTTETAGKFGGKEKMAQNLIHLLGDTSDRFRNSIEDQIVGKTIVLEKNKATDSNVAKLKRYNSTVISPIK